MRSALIFSLLLWSAQAARAKPNASADDPDASITDPDLKMEMRSAEKDSLNANLSRSMKDALKSAQNIDYILEASKNYAGSSAQALSDYARDFRTKARAAALDLPQVNPGEYLMRRSGYRAAERSRDLRKGERLLARFSGRGSTTTLGPAQVELLTVAQSALGELRRAREVASQEAQASPQERSQERLVKLQMDIRDLGREIRLLEIALSMHNQDESSFNAPKERP